MTAWITCTAIGLVEMGFAGADLGPPQAPAGAAAPHCGVACVLALLQSQGRSVSLASVEMRFREMYPDADTGRLHLGQLRRVLASFGLRARTVQADLRSGEFPTPAVLFLGRDRHGEKMPVGHFVLLRRLRKGQVEVTDAVYPPRVQWVPIDDLARFSDGQMLVVEHGVWEGVATLAQAIAVLGLLVSTITMAVLAYRRHAKETP